MAGLLSILLGLCICLSSTLVQASDDEYLQLLQDRYLEDAPYNHTNENFTCEVNPERTGFICQNISVLDTTIVTIPLHAWFSMNSTFDFPNSELFLYQVEASAFYSDVANATASFEFNSTTPDGTILAVGKVDVGRFNLSTGNIFLPTIPTGLVVSYNVTLWKPDECANDAANFSFCNNGTLHAVFGIHGEGSQEIAGNVKVTIRIDEPEALVATIPFEDMVDRTDFCQTLNETAEFKEVLTTKVEVCVPGFPCFTDERHVEVGDSLDLDRTLEDNQCFKHSFVPPP